MDVAGPSGWRRCGQRLPSAPRQPTCALRGQGGGSVQRRRTRYGLWQTTPDVSHDRAASLGLVRTDRGPRKERLTGLAVPAGLRLCQRLGIHELHAECSQGVRLEERVFTHPKAEAQRGWLVDRLPHGKDSGYVRTSLAGAALLHLPTGAENYGCRALSRAPSGRSLRRS